MTRESKNVVLARWLDIPVIAAPDFYTSEEASALLLEKLTADPQWCCVELKWDGWGKIWKVILRRGSLDEHDKHEPAQPVFAWKTRLEAIAEACLAWISAEEKRR